MLPLFNPCEAEVITTGLACVAPVIVFVGASVRSEAVVETLKLYEEPPVTLTVSPGENSLPLPPSIFNFLVDFTTSIAVAVAPETAPVKVSPSATVAVAMLPCKFWNLICEPLN